MPASSRFFSASSETFGISRVISSGPSLVSRAFTSNSSMWIEVKTSSFTIRSESGRGTVGNDVALVHEVADLHQRTLVDAGRLVGALVLHQPVDIDARPGRIEIFRGTDDDAGGVDLVAHARTARRDRS